jgi:hypothetical protein
LFASFPRLLFSEEVNVRRSEEPSRPLNKSSIEKDKDHSRSHEADEETPIWELLWKYLLQAFPNHFDAEELGQIVTF